MNGKNITDTVIWKSYEKAESFLPWNLFKKAFNVHIKPNWISLPGLSEHQFWYLSQTTKGKEFILVDIEAESHKPLFDHEKLAIALSQITGQVIEKSELPFDTIEFGEDCKYIFFEHEGRLWKFDLDDNKIEEDENRVIQRPDELLSPNLKRAVFIKNHNLWVRTILDSEEYLLTNDGDHLNDYASRSETNTVAVIKVMKGEPLPPVALWSPDSKKILTHKLNQKEVKEFHLVQSVPADGSIRPKMHSIRYPLPGDEKVAFIEFVILDIEKRSNTKIQHKPQTVPFLYTPIESGRAWWSEDSLKIYFLYTEPGDKTIRLCEADATTGQTRILLEESSSTHIDVNLNPSGLPNIRVTKNGNYIIWFSERDGWGHLYLYDGENGKLINQITQGNWVVRDILYIDEDHEYVYFTAGGRETNRDPYYRFLYRISFRGDNLTLLTPEDGDHVVSFSREGKYFIDTYSRVDIAPITVIRDCEGKHLCHLEEADISQIVDMGWKKPERFCVKGRDGKTDIYGLLYYPTSFDPSKKYPIIDDVYPGPQSIRTIKSFPQDPLTAIDFWGPQAISELGFLVITMDGMGTPLRSKEFHDVSYGNLGDCGLEDHITGIRQLASNRPYMDLDKIGIYGHSAGGFASARAILTYSEVFKVAVSSAGNHDQRGFLAGWGEKYQGLFHGDNYHNQINADLAKNLKGKLLLIYGDMDMGVHSTLTIQLIDALIKENRDIDLVILPNRDHFYMNDPYFIRKTWDYFVQHLLELSAPLYKIKEPDEAFTKEVY